MKESDHFQEDAPLATNGCVIFEGVTKEAHDKLKADFAALSSEVERMRGVVAAYEHHFHVLHPDAIKGILKQIARRAMEGRDGS